MDRAIALIAEPVGGPPDPRRMRGWLARLGHELDELYGPDLLAPFASPGGVELRGLLRPVADPVGAVLRGALGEDGRRMRWAIVLGATEPTATLGGELRGEPWETARGAIARARREHDAISVVTGDPRSDRLLEAIAPVLGDMLARLTLRQRTVARLLLIEGRRQADVAERLGVSRQTVSVNVARSRLRSMTRLAAAISALFADAAAATPTDAPAATPQRERSRDPRLAAAAALARR